MPTAARLVAGLCLAGVGWFVSQLIMPLMPEGTAFGWFSVLNAALGLVIGWQVIGSRAGRGISAAISNGLTAGVVLLLWGLFLQSSYKMFNLSMRGRYDGAFEAGADVFNRMVEFGAIIATPAVLGALVLGAVMSGIIAEITGRFAS